MCFEKKTEGGMNPVEGAQRILEQVKLAVKNGASITPPSSCCFPPPEFGNAGG